MDIITTSAVIVGGMSFIFGACLTYVSYKFAVVLDPRKELLLKILPGVNCGACGFAGCGNYADKLAAGEILSPNLCVPGSDAVAREIAKILGIDEVSCKNPCKAVIICGGGSKEAVKQFEYDGVYTCKGANLIAGGNKVCKYGCIGFGDCTRVCPFDAIHMSNNGLPVVNNKCNGCGKCINECPKKVLTLVDNKHFVNILCHSNDKGVLVRKICTKGCIGCMKCVKACPTQAIEYENFLAKINYTKCNNCGECIKVCPTGTII
ncbi:RnfABCDGE type electron transport complex subunit B [Candidatus Desantisbacteria bacterium]|nr:RnfABCDGE type electron transport complex subunit B [Candidatus Desantisbacteria bacterium]